MTANNRPQTPSDPATGDEAAGTTKGSNIWGDELAASASDDLDTPPPPASAERPDPYARPMSERQRRRLAEQQRLAEQRAAEAEKLTSGQLSPMAESADAPPVAAANRQPAVKTTKTRTRQDTKRTKPETAGPAYILATLASVLWLGGIGSFVAYEFGSGMIDLDPVRLAVYALIGLMPVGLFYLIAHMARLGNGIAQESRRAREMADAMIAPTAHASQEAGGILSMLRTDIESTQQLADRARADLAALREAFVNETSRLADAARTAQASTHNITHQLGQERQQLTTLGETLDQKALTVADAVQRQAQMVVEASDLAQAQLREAEAALAARAADLAAAANEAQDAARVAAEDLGRQTLRLETAGTSVTEQIKTVEDGLSQQRAALATAAYALRTDQEDFAAQIETQRSQFVEQLSLTRTAAAELNHTGDQIAESIKSQVEAVLEQFRALVSMSHTEAEGFDAATKMSLDKFEMLAAQSRDRLLDETRRAIESLQTAAAEQRALADQALQQAQIRADRLGESLFDAARQADDAAESRIEGARRIVAETLNLVDQAGIEASNRLETMTHRMTDALSRIEASVRDMDERAARMPEEAAQRVAAVRSTVEQGLASLSDASRRAAADTEALDAGFQDRVRRNYEMLTEAVRLMGVVAPDAAPAAPAQSYQPAPTQPVSRPAPEQAAPSAAPFAAPNPATAGGWQNFTGTAPLAGAVPPTAAMQPLVPSAPPEPAVTLDMLAERATAAIRRMGVDPNALLPRARVEDAAQAWARNEPVRARQIVRRVAPAAVRSVARRVNGDAALAAEINTFIVRYTEMLGHTGGDQDAVQMRLATDEGRAFMLLDAALGEMI